MNNKQTGFTLVELAIVLVVIGLILGMAFKGKDLIDSAKVKNMQAQYNKVSAAVNIYYEKYGSYPGDGCTGVATAGTTCSNANPTRDGILSNAEGGFGITVLQNANILTKADLQSPFGQDWTIAQGAAANNFDANTDYVTIGTSGLSTASADIRFVCALDRLMDDGAPTTGAVRSSSTNTDTDTTYNSTSDCWAKSGQVMIGIRVLP